VGAVLMGLLLPHKSRIHIYPDMMTISTAGTTDHKGGGKRGEIQIFSPESRLRLFKLLHQITFNSVTFITLTYPDEFPDWGEKYKYDLKLFRGQIEYKFGKLPAIWRLEFQARGAPHYHIMYFDAPFMPVAEINNAWAKISDPKNKDEPRKNALDLKFTKDAKEQKLIAYYLSKYIAKVDKNSLPAGCKPGRFWGKWNIIEREPIEMEVNNSYAYLIASRAIQARKFKAYEPESLLNCTIMGETMGKDEFLKMVLTSIPNGIE